MPDSSAPPDTPGVAAMSVLPSAGSSAGAATPSSGTVNAGTQLAMPSRHTRVDGASTLLASADRSSSTLTTRWTP